MPSKLPGPLRLAPSLPFAGRSRELALLRTLVPRGENDSLRFALVGGEAGSGKSRLVREFAHEAAQGGTLVLYGACDSVVQRPYRPFVEALDQLVRTSDTAMLRADLGAGAGELTRPLPAPGRRRGRVPAPAPRPPPPPGGAARAGRRRSRHRAPPPAHRGRRAPRRG